MLNNGPTVGSAIRDARESRGLTQEELAESVGISRITLIQIEAGRKEDQLRVALVTRIAEVLRVSPNRLLRPSRVA